MRGLEKADMSLCNGAWSVVFTVLTSSCMAVCGALTLLFSHHFTVLTSRCMAVRGEIPLLFSHRVVEGGGGGTANATLS